MIRDMLSLHNTKKGGYNIVYNMNLPCKTKMIYRKTIKKLSHKKQLKHDFAEEVSMNILTSTNKISPTVYYSGEDPEGHGVIVLQKYETDLRHLIEKHDIRQEIVERSLNKLFKRLASLNIFCWDLKLLNVVGDYNPTTSKLTLRLIDFDTYFCKAKTKADKAVSTLALKIVMSANTKHRTGYTLFQKDIRGYFMGSKAKSKRLFEALKMIEGKAFRTLNRYRGKKEKKKFTETYDILKYILLNLSPGKYLKERAFK